MTWKTGEKIDALKPLIGKEAAIELQKTLNWVAVAHRKVGPRLGAADSEMAQRLLVAVLTRLELCLVGEPEALL